MTAYDVEWADQVREMCDPIFNAAQVGFECQLLGVSEAGTVGGLLWEADPAQFAAKYPDSGIVETYGSDWESTSCIDYELTIDDARFNSSSLSKVGTFLWFASARAETDDVTALESQTWSRGSWEFRRPGRVK
ncbi:hypothetical protein ACFFOS_28015 [Nocardioides kongjuensis]|uniref:Uncharacterized protein n=1 Tax=Nocardioides kongjuensis TaxID=349522 RepID=A0A852RPR8_9ACTN|nr:hypothetical protein [Nocardioides kongjuensis]NYD32699.1 hypothetical protein [Nocardioides kongjuensis]